MSLFRPGPAATPKDDLASWRSELTDRAIGLTVLVNLLPACLLTAQALRTGIWGDAALIWVSTLVMATAGRWRRLPYQVRALLGTLMIYMIGVWLLTRGGAAGMLYLLAFPVMVALALETRAAIVALCVSMITLTGLGWLLQLPISSVYGMPGRSVPRWATVTSNLLVVGLLVTLAAGFLLRRLEKAMADHRDSAVLLREVASQVPGVVFRLRLDDDWQPRFLFVSPGSRELLGLSPEALLADARAMTRCLHTEDLKLLRDRVRAGEVQHEAQMRLTTPQGRTRWLQLQASQVQREDRTVVLNGVLTDITERKRAEALVLRQAYVDLLTGLPNRLSMQIELSKVLGAARHGAHRFALLLVDLDRFKEVNDTQGHSGGDALLAQAGQRLQACLREGDHVARMGGDEFVLLLPQLAHERDAETTAQRVLDALSEAFVLNGQQAQISASLGIAIYPDDGAQPDELLSHADQALYEAKGSGRNRYCRFTATLHARGQRRLRLAQDLRTAIARGEMSLVYQPVVELSTGRAQKAEALLRWQHPELGAVSPAEFVPIAEGTGLIGDIGQWVLRTACAQAALWRQHVDPEFRIAINHSPMQFRSDGRTGPSLAAQLQQHGLAGEALVVEITEGLLLEHSDDLARQLHDLRSLGVQIALDDFGTGYSSLAYLHRYPIDLLKIDRSFVSGAAAGHTGRSLCRAMVALASELGLQVVAEGVEPQEQERWLHGIGCQQAQGWLYARAMPPNEFERWMLARRPGAAEGAVADVGGPPSREVMPGLPRGALLDAAGPSAPVPSAGSADRPPRQSTVASIQTT